MSRAAVLREKIGHSPRKGILIAIEGIDGAGKTTQAQKLRQNLASKGLDAVVFKEPTMKTEWSRKIALLGEHGRTLSAEEESRYFLEDRKEDVKRNILPALQEGKIVIMDRYYYSNMAYQGAKGMNPRLIEEENLKFAPRPRMTIFLDITSATARRRIRNSRNGETNHFEQRLGPVRQAFLEIARTHSEVKTIDGDLPTEEVEARIAQLVTS